MFHRKETFRARLYGHWLLLRGPIQQTNGIWNKSWVIFSWKGIEKSLYQNHICMSNLLNSNSSYYLLIDFYSNYHSFYCWINLYFFKNGCFRFTITNWWIKSTDKKSAIFNEFHTKFNIFLVCQCSIISIGINMQYSNKYFFG